MSWRNRPSTISGETVAISAGVRPESVVVSIVASALAAISDRFSTAKYSCIVPSGCSLARR